ncbi:MAG: hypothetical protein NUW37_00625 [Planctomycetes bacterium]|nr:hypothetical protein [Planctomycetota bacterium]
MTSKIDVIKDFDQDDRLFRSVHRKMFIDTYNSSNMGNYEEARGVPIKPASYTFGLIDMSVSIERALIAMKLKTEHAMLQDHVGLVSLSFGLCRQLEQQVIHDGPTKGELRDDHGNVYGDKNKKVGIDGKKVKVKQAMKERCNWVIFPPYESVKERP